MKTERPHQTDALVCIKNEYYIENKPICNISMSCGTGKTLIFLWCIERVIQIKYGASVIFAPNIHLCYQNYKEFADNKTKDFETMLVCTGSDIKEEKDFVTGIEGDIKVSTDQSDIDAFMNNGSNRNKILFCTYHSAEKLLEYNFDFCVSDEAHRTAGSKHKKFATVHEISATKKLFATATPKVRSEAQIKKFGNGDDRFYYCMSDHRFYGKCVYELGLKQAIKLGLINDYQIIIYGIDRTMIPQEVLQYIQHGDEMVYINYAIEKFMEEMGVKKVAIFHSLIKHSKNFVKYHDVLIAPRTGDKVLHIDGTVKLNERIKAFEEFRSADRAILSNVRAIGEGHNESCMEAVVFVSDKDSAVDIVQSSCRPLRKHPGKEKSYIVLPIFYDQKKTTDGVKLDMTKEDIDEMAEDETSNFSNVIRILRHLSVSDSRLESYINLSSTPQHEEHVVQRTMEDIEREVTGMVNDIINFKDFPFKIIGMEEYIKAAIFKKVVSKFSGDNWVEDLYQKSLLLLPPEKHEEFKVKFRAKWIEVNGGF